MCQCFKVTLFDEQFFTYCTDDDGNVLRQKNLSDWAFREGKRMMLTGVR